MDTLDKLRELTPKLPPVPKMGDYKVEGAHYTEYKIKNGTCLSYNIPGVDGCSISRTLVTSGGIIEMHDHNEKEFIVILSGTLMIYFNNKQRTLKRADCISFEKNVAHRAIALEDTWMLGVTIPESKDFPTP